MMLQQELSITMLLLSAGLAAAALQQGYGWLDRVVQFQKNKLFKEVKELAPIETNGKFAVELRPKPKGYEDSRHWDDNSVLRLLKLIRESETAKPVHKALRRMLSPTRRIMMSMKESMHRFPSLKKDDNNFYYDVDYTSAEENAPPTAALPEGQAVIVVSNPVEARLPSARISVKLLREILEARARAARQMPSTTKIVPWIEFIKNRTLTSTEDTNTDAGTTESGKGVGNSTDVADDQTTNAADPEGEGESTTAEEGGTNTTGGEPETATEGTTGTEPEGGGTVTEPQTTEPN